MKLRRRRVRDMVRGAVVIERDGNPLRTSRVAIVAHWSKHPGVTKSLCALIGELQQNDFGVVVASSCEAPAPLEWHGPVDAAQLTVIRKPNLGYDFGSWSVALELFPDVAAADVVVLTNDSMAGPFRPLAQIIATLDATPTDVFGLTDTQQFAAHLQSYFLAFKGGALAERPLQRFFAAVGHETDKLEIIFRYELGLALLLRSDGFTIAPAFPFERVVDPGLNPVITGWRELLALGFPFVKREILRDPSVAPGGETAPAVLSELFGVDVRDWVDDVIAAEVAR